MTEREKRKRMLIAENEVCRGLLKLQIHNIRIAGVRVKRRFTAFGLGNPLLLLALPMAGSMFRRKRRFSWKRLGALAYLGWQTYRRFRPLWSRQNLSGNSRAERTEAEEFLERKI
jgi:hypothetical protein